MAIPTSRDFMLAYIKSLCLPRGICTFAIHYIQCITSHLTNIVPTAVEYFVHFTELWLQFAVDL